MNNVMDECTQDQMCLENGCQECCEHEFDPSEGLMCIDCGLQGDACDVYGEYERHE